MNQPSKLNKTRLIILLGILLIVTIISLILYKTGSLKFQAETTGPSISLNPSSGSYKVGDTFDVEINVDTADQAAGGFSVRYLHYDKDKLEVVGGQVQTGSVNPGDTSFMANNVDQANGTILLSAIFGSPFTGSGVAGTITFKVNAESTSPSDVTFDFISGSTLFTKISGAAATDPGANILTSATGGSYTLESGIVPVPTVNIKAKGSDGPVEIDSGTATDLSWTSTDATTCIASVDWSGAKATSGTESTGNLTASKTYTLTCTNSAGSKDDSVTVNVKDKPSVNLKANNADGPVQINYNTATTLSWTSANATSCTASSGWSGVKATSGTESTGNLTESKTYTLTCKNDQDVTANDSVTVNVGTEPQPTPTVALKANGSNSSITISTGTAATLSWSSKNADNCVASNGWTGTKAASGSESTGDLTASKTYTLICRNGSSGPKGSDSITVNVTSLPIDQAPTADIKANNSDDPITVEYDKGADLAWTSTNSDSCTASGGWTGDKSTSGTESTGNLTESKIYTLTCKKGDNSASDSVAVNVSGKPIAEEVTSPATTDTTPNTVTPTPSKVTTTTKPTTTSKTQQLFLGKVVKPWAMWLFYALIPITLTAGVIFFYLWRKRKNTIKPFPKPKDDWPNSVI